MSWPSPEWRNYCIYSGRYLPDSAMNDEHVIPKSLGGYRSTIIRASRELNSSFATTIDAKIANDPMIQFGRRDANTRGHSRKEPVPIIRGARAWKRGAPWDEVMKEEPRYNLSIPKTETHKIYDTKTGKTLPRNTFRDTGFIVMNWEIDHVARIKFCLKTLLGIGWKFFRTDILSSVDIEKIRELLIKSAYLSDKVSEDNGISYCDPFLVKAEDLKEHPIKKIEHALVRSERTTILIREFDDKLEWSVACVGYMVGSVRVPILSPLLRGDIQPRGGILLVINRDRLIPELVSPIGR